jgi:hypothetical protein
MAQTTSDLSKIIDYLIETVGEFSDDSVYALKRPVDGMYIIAERTLNGTISASIQHQNDEGDEDDEDTHILFVMNASADKFTRMYRNLRDVDDSKCRTWFVFIRDLDRLGIYIKMPDGGTFKISGDSIRYSDRSLSVAVSDALFAPLMASVVDCPQPFDIVRTTLRDMFARNVEEITGTWRGCDIRITRDGITATSDVASIESVRVPWNATLQDVLHTVKLLC